MALNFTTTRQASELSGIKVLVYGQAGIGKTVLCSTAPSPFLISAEAGELSLRGFDIPMVRIKTMNDLMEVYEWASKSKEAENFETLCLDSISEIAEVVLANEKANTRDARQAYGELITKMESIIRAFRDITGKNVYMSAKIEPFKDDLTGVVKYVPSMPGSKLSSKIPYFFDEVFRLAIKKAEDGTSFRFLQTQPDFQFEAKDRSGALDPMEKPDLTYVFNKIMKGN